MMPPSAHLSDNRGVAIVAVTLVMVVAALLGGVIILQTSQDNQLSERTYRDKQALYLAESAKERTYREIMNDTNFTTLANPGTVTDVGMQAGTYDLVATTLSESPKVVEIVATGRMAGVDKQVTVVAEVIEENVCVWSNAIFGGAGQAGGVINGNCAIHGAVHLLGEGVGVGNPSIEALDLSGSSLIHNNYEGIPAELLAKVPALPTTVFGGETVSTLSAKLRVKHGSVGISGDSEIGEANIVGNAFKETMDGIYIEVDAANPRWTGNQVVDGVPNPDNVRSDNGTDALYDLADKVQMPSLSDPYTDGGGTLWPSYDAYYAANSLTLPPLILDNTTSAATTIQGYIFPAGVTVETDGSKFKVTDGVNTIAYDPAVANGRAGLGVSGMIRISGDLVIGRKNLDITYGGKGTIYAAGGAGQEGDIYVHSNLLPVRTFPIDDVLGIMAKKDLNLATGAGDSQLSMAAAFYAEGQVTSPKQNKIVGTFVCNYFDMGTNVPKIYMVPALADNLPPGLIGSEPIWVVTGFQERSWRID